MRVPTGSVQGMKGMLRLIDNSIPQIIVLSATTETTERLAGIAAHLFNRDTEQAHDEISRLEFRFIDFANELFNDESIKQQAVDSIIDRFLDSMELYPPTFYICRRERHTGTGRIYQQYTSQPLSERAGNRQPSYSTASTSCDWLRKKNRTWNTSVQSYTPLLAEHKSTNVFLTQGHLCRNAYNETCYLKQGGDDVSATLIGAALSGTRSMSVDRQQRVAQL